MVGNKSRDSILEEVRRASKRALETLARARAKLWAQAERGRKAMCESYQSPTEPDNKNDQTHNRIKCSNCFAEIAEVLCSDCHDKIWHDDYDEESKPKCTSCEACDAEGGSDLCELCEIEKAEMEKGNFGICADCSKNMSAYDFGHLCKSCRTVR